MRIPSELSGFDLKVYIEVYKVYYRSKLQNDMEIRKELMWRKFEMSKLFILTLVRLFPGRRKKLSRVKTLVCSFDL